MDKMSVKYDFAFFYHRFIKLIIIPNFGEKQKRIIVLKRFNYLIMFYKNFKKNPTLYIYAILVHICKL